MVCNYREIFNNSNITIENTKDGYEVLSTIHSKLFGSENTVRRYQNGSEESNFVSLCVNELLNIDFNIERRSIAYKIANNISLLYLYQPFSDGNTRTLYFFLKVLLSKYVDVKSWVLDDTEISSIPFYTIYYYEEEHPYEANIEYIEEKLSLTRKTF